jgi:hypothetical protein
VGSPPKAKVKRSNASGLPKSLCRVRCGGSNRGSAAVAGTRNEFKLLAVKFARR